MKALIVKLMEEANGEAEQKGWCDDELATNEQTRKEKTEAVETLHAAGRLRESLGWPLPTDPATNHQLALSESSICKVKAATKIEWQLQGAPTA